VLSATGHLISSSFIDCGVDISPAVDTAVDSSAGVAVLVFDEMLVCCSCFLGDLLGNPIDAISTDVDCSAPFVLAGDAAAGNATSVGVAVVCDAMSLIR
jgi:hypothetical protein